MPGIVKLFEQYGRGRVDFLAVSCDGMTGTAQEIPAVMKQLNMTVPTRILVTDDQNAAIRAFDEEWSGALPMTFVYDARGKKVHCFTGAQTLEAFEKAIQEVTGG
jgi:thiol:disulfide interchange protein